MNTINLKKDSLAGLSFSILSDLLLDIIFEIALSTHKREVFSKRKCLRCNKFCHYYSINPGSDIFGKPYQTPITAPYYSCTICGREIAAGRYVPHLEKCLGSGRLSNRLAQQKTNGYGTSISSTNNVENDISSEDETQHRKKRRRPTNGSTKSGSTKSHIKLKKSSITSNSSDVDLQT
ncbi:hypothetical protein T552_00369 [Pneumocystis carinii B80]|uniref:SAGA-associated factor 11 n=1 Tax=Pneumocystis carinii (strain B80) TaxID=1408658 RepID=A0A0W4ZQK0_PNEC8|nr:hypothetical protein T552_00369 [Pneumocystis carinii B80]KTW30654.1 hypothetical protein T552_00369 [Pneumocystis carinii B80]